MASGFDTGFEGYEELADSEVEPGPAQDESPPVSSQPHDWTIGSLREKYEAGKIDLQPHYQRECPKSKASAMALAKEVTTSNESAMAAPVRLRAKPIAISSSFMRWTRN